MAAGIEHLNQYVLPALALIGGPVAVEQSGEDTRVHLAGVVSQKSGAVASGVEIDTGRSRRGRASRIHVAGKDHELAIRRNGFAAGACGNGCHLVSSAAVRVHRPDLRTVFAVGDE